MILVDTNVLSELSKHPADDTVTNWIFVHGEQLRIPAIVFSELHFGVDKMPTSRHRDHLQRWLGRLEQRFVDRVVPFDLPVAKVHGRLRAQLKRLGKPMNATDSMIAATGLALGKPVATRNVKDFRECGVTVIDPWND